jgi:DNA replication and repair protein RecF
VHVATLSLRDFRSYPSLDLAWEPGVTVLVGANGQGKTNIVEAVHYLSTLGSHRAGTDTPLVRAGRTSAHLAARVRSGDRSLTLELDLNVGQANKARVNRSPVRTSREVVGLLRTVLFAPEDLAIVKGDPGERRRFLDQLLVQRRPRLAGVRADYDRVLKQRTALVKSASALRRHRGRAAADLTTLDVWDGHLARTGADLVAGRIGLLDDLGPRVAGVYADLAPGSGAASAAYRSSVLGFGVDAAAAQQAGAAVPAWEQLLGSALAQARSAELDRGQCLVGPHRDDVVLSLGELPARGYASQGEAWSFALALRLASFDLLTEESDSTPVLMLDDVFAELDARRRDHLAARVGQADQVIVTAAVSDDVPSALDGTRYAVVEGEVRRVG